MSELHELQAEYERLTGILLIHYTGENALPSDQLSEVEALHWDAQRTYIAALETERNELVKTVWQKANSLFTEAGYELVVGSPVFRESTESYWKGYRLALSHVLSFTEFEAKNVSPAAASADEPTGGDAT